MTDNNAGWGDLPLFWFAVVLILKIEQARGCNWVRQLCKLCRETSLDLSQQEFVYWINIFDNKRMHHNTPTCAKK